MDFVHILPFLSTAVMAFFTASVFYRYLKGRRMYSLTWSIGLALYGLGTFAEAYLAIAWSPLLLRLWYLSGAMLTAAWLAQGTIYLLVRKPGLASALMWGLLVISIVSLALVFAAPMEAGAFHAGVPVSTQYKAILERSGLMVFLTVLLNIYGTLGLIGGAVYSAWLFRRKHILPNRMIGNIFIAVGALFPAGAGALIRVGLADYLYVSELAGAALMFVGFVLATQPQPVEQARPVTAQA